MVLTRREQPAVFQLVRLVYHGVAVSHNLVIETGNRRIDLRKTRPALPYLQRQLGRFWTLYRSSRSSDHLNAAVRAG
jgi:hypothetical protein